MKLLSKKLYYFTFQKLLNLEKQSKDFFIRELEILSEEEVFNLTFVLRQRGLI